MYDPNASNQNATFRNVNSEAAPPPYQASKGDMMNRMGLEAVSTPKYHQFYIKYTSELEGRIYEGQFSSKKLSVYDYSQLSVRKVQLNGGYHYDENRPGMGIDQSTDSLNHTIAHLEIALVQAPSWFNIKEMTDMTLLFEVFKKVMEFENNFFRREGSAFNDNGGRQDGSSGTGAPSGAAGRVTEVGREQIQSALEP